MKQQAVTEGYQTQFLAEVIMIQVHLIRMHDVFIWSINKPMFQRNVEDRSASIPVKLKTALGSLQFL